MTVALTRVRLLRVSEIAWIAAVPCALAMLVAILVLGPPLGHALAAPPSEVLWPPEVLTGRPEAAKHGRFVVALLGPVLLSGAIWLAARRPHHLRPALIDGMVLASQAIALGFVVVALAVQENIVWHTEPALWPPFGRRTIVVAAALALLLMAGLRSPALVRLVRRRAGLFAETRLLRTVCFLAAALLTAIWLLPAVNSEASIGWLRYLTCRRGRWATRSPS